MRHGHENPQQLPIQSRVQVADHVTVGVYELGPEIKDRFGKFIDITSDTRPDDSGVKLHSGMYYHCNDVFNPEVGDIRLLFSVAGIEGNRVCHSNVTYTACSHILMALHRSFAVHHYRQIRERARSSLRVQ